LDFAAANSEAFDRKRDEQLALLGRKVGGVLRRQFVKMTTPLAPDKLDDALQLFADLVEASRRGQPPFQNATPTYRDNGAESSGIRVPFLFVSWLKAIDAYIDEFVGDFRSIFAFDTASLSASNESDGTHAGNACCNILPQEDETVFVRGSQLPVEAVSLCC
jgi:hypothetical protein